MKIVIYVPNYGDPDKLDRKNLKPVARKRNGVGTVGWAAEVTVREDLLTEKARDFLKAMMYDLSGIREDDDLTPRPEVLVTVPRIREAAQALGLPLSAAESWERMYGPLGGNSEHRGGVLQKSALWHAFKNGNLEEKINSLAATPGLSVWTPGAGERVIIQEGSLQAPPNVWEPMLRSYA